ncbi:MAG: hypothetical protein H6813_02345 [Phycisphaeraceae bacterium]|nr:hypothetical protein [Phycisphaeraceae bacterium]MCB9848842.1 hypothetical protein [Phycisphaeraceae bacterium]
MPAPNHSFTPRKAGPGRLALTAAGFAALLLSTGAVIADPQFPDSTAVTPLYGFPAPALSAEASRSRVIALDLTAIAPDANARSVVEFALFDDAVFRATTQSVNVIGDGRWSWVGTLDGDPFGVAQFAVRDGVAAGVIRSTDRGVFRVRYSGEPGVYVAEAIDPANLEPCATGPEQLLTTPRDFDPDRAQDPEGAGAPRGALTNIDVLVGYTAQARTLAGGTAGMLAEIDLAIASANLAYQNSNVDIELTLVLTYLALYNESGNASTDLFNWRETNDGFMDDVHTQRDDIAADMCALIVSNFDACGIGNLMTVPSLAFEDRAFTVTALGCAVSNLSFAHELGHNLGCAHDHDNATIGAYSYSFGYRDPLGTPDWRTIMAYAPGTRIQYFSNPLVSFNGQLIGVATGPGAANNSMTMNQTRGYASNWRDAATRQPLAFALGSPANGQQHVWSGEEFSWEANGPVDSYTLVIATDAALTNEVLRVEGILGASYDLPSGALGGCETLYWGVEATLAGNSRAASPISRSFTTRLASDINVDDMIDTADLGGLIGSFGSTNPFADLNNDGVTDTADLGILLGDFGQTCVP